MILGGLGVDTLGLRGRFPLRGLLAAGYTLLLVRGARSITPEPESAWG
jgi:hypothetical protein